MENYYTDIIQTIHQHIEQKQYYEALEILHVELSMPYIPLEHKEVFEDLLYEARGGLSKIDGLYTNLEEIKMALLKKGAYIDKALSSLQNLNLRHYLDEFKSLFELDLENEVKRAMIYIAFEQQLDTILYVKLNQKLERIDVGQIENPFTHPHYQKIFVELHESFENYDPSFLNLCLEILQLNIMNHFPFVDESLNTNQIVDKVNQSLNKR